MLIKAKQGRVLIYYKKEYKEKERDKSLSQKESKKEFHFINADFLKEIKLLANYESK